MRRSAFLNRYTLLIGILLAVVVLSPGPGASRAGAALHDFAHAPVFAVITFALLLLLERRRGQPLALKDYAVAFVLGVSLGLITEIVQKVTGGDASWFDLRSDTIGAAAACGFFAACDRRLRTRLRMNAALAGLAALVLHSAQFAQVALAYGHRDSVFPVLFDAANSRAHGFTVATDATLEYTTLAAPFAKQSGEPSLLIRLSRGSWPGVAFEEPHPDWSRYRALMLDLANPQDTPLELNLRVADRAHNWRSEDRFDRTVTITSSARTVIAIPIAEIERAPRGRRLDTRAIADVRLFGTDASAGRTFYVTRVWLE